jgi:hypothetical protein
MGPSHLDLRSEKSESLMIRVFALITVALCCITSAGASTVSCNSQNVAEYIAIAPASPSSAQQITLTVGIFSYDPQSVSIQLQGNTIGVTLTAAFIGFLPPPPTCIASVIGPLAPGIYTVNLSLFDSNSPQLGTVFLTSTTFAVSGGASSIPTMHWVPLVSMCVILALSAARALRRRPNHQLKVER